MQWLGSSGSSSGQIALPTRGHSSEKEAEVSGKVHVVQHVAVRMVDNIPMKEGEVFVPRWSKKNSEQF